MLSLGLRLSVLAAVGQIDGNLQHRRSTGICSEVAPAYGFQRDIQPGQVAAIPRDPGERSGCQRARIWTAPRCCAEFLSRIDGRPPREVAGDHWVVTGDRGITYATAPDANTRVVAGEWWAPDHDGPPEVSFAIEEAEEMGLSLGDELTVNVLGLTSRRQLPVSAMWTFRPLAWVS